jgi:hypothetical protein
MAAVLCLVMLPLMAALGFMLGVVQGEWSGASFLAGAAFVLLGSGLFVGAFKLAQGWDESEQH